MPKSEYLNVVRVCKRERAAGMRGSEHNENYTKRRRVGVVV